MLAKQFEFKDFNGNTKRRTFYFNLSKAELIKLEASQKGGLTATMQHLMETEDREKLLELFTRVILMSVGEKSPDGERFVKSDEAAIAFSQTPAFDLLLVEVISNSEAAVAFISGIIPEDLLAKLKENGQL